MTLSKASSKNLACGRSFKRSFENQVALRALAKVRSQATRPFKSAASDQLPTACPHSQKRKPPKTHASILCAITASIAERSCCPTAHSQFSLSVAY